MASLLLNLIQCVCFLLAFHFLLAWGVLERGPVVTLFLCVGIVLVSAKYGFRCGVRWQKNQQQLVDEAAVSNVEPAGESFVIRERSSSRPPHPKTTKLPRRPGMAFRR